MQMLRAAPALLAALAALAAAPPAHADCASPGVATSPPTGAKVSPDPTIYVFLPVFGDRVPPTDRIQVTADGVPIPARVEQVSSSDAFIAVRVSIETDGQRQIAVSYDSGWERGEARFSIARDRRNRKRPEAVLAGVERRKDAWTCSFTDAWFLTMSTPADAYRVEWATSPAAWERGAQTVTVFPRSGMDFWHRPDESSAARPTTRGSIGLGHLNCFAYTIPAAAVDGPLFVKVTGLFADGTETSAWTAPRRIDDGLATPTPATAAEVVTPTADPAPVREPAESARPVEQPIRFASDDLWDRAAPAAGAGLLAAALVVAIGSRRARRRKLTRSAPPPH
jgi:hypothetical protein